MSDAALRISFAVLWGCWFVFLCFTWGMEISVERYSLDYARDLEI